MNKLFFEYYDGKYCKIPDNLKYEGQMPPHHKLEFWVFKDKNTGKFLKWTNPDDLETAGDLSFTADTHTDNDIFVVTAGAILNDLEEHNDNPAIVTLETLSKENIVLLPYIREVLCVFIDGTKAYSTTENTFGKFMIKELANIPEIPENKVWDGYYMGETKVDEEFIFSEWMAGSTIISKFHDTCKVNIHYIANNIEVSKETLEFKYNTKAELHKDISDETYETLEEVYSNIECTEIIENTTPIIKENIDVYIKVSKKYTVTIINEEVEYRSEHIVLDGETLTLPQDPHTDGYIYTGLFKDPFCKEPADLVITSNITLYAGFTRDNEFTLRIDGKEYVGIYQSDLDVYKFYMIEIADDLVGVRVKNKDTDYVIKIDKLGVLSIPAKYKFIGTVTPEHAKPVKWNIYPCYALDGQILGQGDPIVVEIPYDRKFQKYAIDLNMDRVEIGDYSEPDIELGFGGRAFANPMCTRDVVSPSILGNHISADYGDGSPVYLPDAFLKLDRKRIMTVSFTSITDGGDIYPREFIVGRDQNLTLKRSMFQTIINPVGKVIDKFVYTHPYTKKRHEVKFGDTIKVEYSYNLHTIWNEPVKAIFIIDEDDRSQDVIIYSDNCDSLAFHAPNIADYTKPGATLIGWTGAPSSDYPLLIHSTQEYHPIWINDDNITKEE